MKLVALCHTLVHGLSSLGHAAALLWSILRGCLLVAALSILLLGAVGCAAAGWGVARLTADALGRSTPPTPAATGHAVGVAGRMPLAGGSEAGHG